MWLVHSCPETQGSHAPSQQADWPTPPALTLPHTRKPSVKGGQGPLKGVSQALSEHEHWGWHLDAWILVPNPQLSGKERVIRKAGPHTPNLSHVSKIASEMKDCPVPAVTAWTHLPPHNPHFLQATERTTKQGQQGYREHIQLFPHSHNIYWPPLYAWWEIRSDITVALLLRSSQLSDKPRNKDRDRCRPDALN